MYRQPACFSAGVSDGSAADSETLPATQTAMNVSERTECIGEGSSAGLTEARSRIVPMRMAREKRWGLLRSESRSPSTPTAAGEKRLRIRGDRRRSATPRYTGRGPADTQFSPVKQHPGRARLPPSRRHV